MSDEEEILPEWSRFQLHDPDDDEMEDEAEEAHVSRIIKAHARQRNRIDRGGGLFATQ